MIKARPTSVVILITLAELAWLAAFGLLFAYRSKVGELGNIRRDFDAASSELALWRTNAPDAAKLLDELKLVNAERTNLRAQLDAFRKQLQGKSPEEVGRLLVDAEQAVERSRDAELSAKKMADELAENRSSIEKLQSELQAATNALAELGRKWDALPPNPTELADRYREAASRVKELEAQLRNAKTNIDGLARKIGDLEQGEIGIRRELTGLPTNDLRRVVFIVDTSSSMHNSPAWDSARQLMRTWVEHLSVDECMLVNFNDGAAAFPKDGYLRVRDATGIALPSKKNELLAAFDNAHTGTYSDLLKGLKLAYSGGKPDVIVLFTDGHPHIATHSDTYFAGEILKEASRHPGTPILTVAVGSYEVEGAGGPRERRNAAISFLKELARRTGGNFLGR